MIIRIGSKANAIKFLSVKGRTFVRGFQIDYDVIVLDRFAKEFIFLPWVVTYWLSLRQHLD